MRTERPKVIGDWTQADVERVFGPYPHEIDLGGGVVSFFDLRVGLPVVCSKELRVVDLRAEHGQ